MKEAIFQGKGWSLLVQIAKPGPYWSPRVNRKVRTQFSGLPRDAFFFLPLQEAGPGEANARAEPRILSGPCPIIERQPGTWESAFMMEINFFLFIGVSIANNFIFIPVTPSKLPECSQELPQPVMQSGTRSMTCY